MASKESRNPGMPLNLDWVRGVHVNRSAVDCPETTIHRRHSTEKEWQVV
jgi:deoxyribose-phosphate aldolase